MHEVKSFVSTKKCIQKYRSSSSYASLCVFVCVCVCVCVCVGGWVGVWVCVGVGV